MQDTVDAQSFYAEYHGHPLHQLARVHDFVRTQGKRVLWLMGDSSMDSKHWLYENRGLKPLGDAAFGPAVNGFEHFLAPPVAVRDVCYHVNKELQEQGLSEYACLNAAVEESTVADREGGLLAHDEFVRDRIQPQDIVFVSLGGNDIALRPSTGTMLAIGALNFLTPTAMVRGGWGPGFGHLKGIFCDQIETFLKRVFEKHTPRLVVPCTIYYPAVSGESWANGLLDRLGYTANSPHKLQALIDSCFKHMTSEIKLANTTVVPLALSTVLDCNDPTDYDNRVEPSIKGGGKMGAAFVHIVKSKAP